ncbi:MAG: hypothetical protein R2877_03875 [Bdellovibrionota bacterium]
MSIIIGLTFGFLGLLTFCIFPIYSIVKAAGNDQFTGAQKFVWAAFIFFTGWIGSMVYLFKHPVSGFHKLQGVLSTIFIMIIAGVFMWSINMAKSGTGQTLVKFKANQTTLETTLRPDQIQTLIASYENLNNEIQKTSVVQFKKLYQLGSVAAMGETQFNDNNFTQEEYNAWIDLYNRRNQISKQEAQELMK